MAIHGSHINKKQQHNDDVFIILTFIKNSITCSRPACIVNEQKTT